MMVKSHIPRWIWATLFAITAYSAASASEDRLIRVRAVRLWSGYMVRDVGAFYKDGLQREASATYPSIFVQLSPLALFPLNGSWIVDGFLASSVVLPGVRLELYQMGVFKCHPSFFECAPGTTKYDFFLLKRVPGSRPEVLRIWRRLQKDMTGYDPAHERYVPDVKASMRYEEITHTLQVSIDHIQQPLTDTLHLDL
jgi:hypothetical protein